MFLNFLVVINTMILTAPKVEIVMPTVDCRAKKQIFETAAASLKSLSSVERAAGKRRLEPLLSDLVQSGCLTLAEAVAYVGKLVHETDDAQVHETLSALKRKVAIENDGVSLHACLNTLTFGDCTRCVEKAVKASVCYREYTAARREDDLDLGYPYCLSILSTKRNMDPDTYCLFGKHQGK